MPNQAKLIEIHSVRHGAARLLKRALDKLERRMIAFEYQRVRYSFVDKQFISYSLIEQFSYP